MAGPLTPAPLPGIWTQLRGVKPSGAQSPACLVLTQSPPTPPNPSHTGYSCGSLLFSLGGFQGAGVP